MLTKKEQDLLDALEPIAAKKGVEIVSLEISGSKKSPTIRVYVDSTSPSDGDSNISFDELMAAQAWINDVVEAIDPFPGAYMLEVSSPGIDRPLRTSAHFMRFAGREATVKTQAAIDGRFSFKGVIVSASDDEVTLDVENTKVTIPFSNIKRANLVGIIDFSRK